MRIAVGTWGTRRAGGVESYLNAMLPALAAAGHEVVLFAELDAPTDRLPIVAGDEVPVWCAAHLGAAELLARLRDWQPEVIYTHGFLNPAFERRVLDLAPAVAFVHAYYGTCISGAKAFRRPVPRPCDRRFGPGCLLRYYPRRIGGLNPVTMLREYRRQQHRLELLPRYHTIATHTEHMRRELLRHELPEATTVKVPFFVRPPPAPVPEPDLNDDVRHLLFVGRMDPLKGGIAAIDALPAVADALGNIHLSFAGDGPERQKWQAHAARVVGPHPRVTTSFEGWLSGEALERAWTHAHLLVVPSLWPEPFGSVGLEAGLRGRPAAAFDVGGISEWLRDGIGGHLAPGDPPEAAGLADAIVKCLSRPNDYLRLCDGALGTAQTFTLERHLAALLPLLTRAASGPS